MSKKTGFIFACLLAGISPALAQTSAACVEPSTPAAVDGTTVTQPDLVADIAAVKKFIADSDTYQQCMADDLNAQKAAAIKNQTPFDPAVQQTVMAKVDANQKAKEKAGVDINTAIGVYKKAHPK